jgi:hypothetical protein
MSDSSCRRTGTAPARVQSAPKGFVPHEERRTRMPRAWSPRARVRDAKEGCPKSLVRPCLAVLPLAAADLLPLGLRRRRQSGPFHPGLTAALRRELCGPAETRPRRAPFGVPVPGRDPSMVDVQPNCQRSAPGIRVGFSSPVSNRVRVSVAIHVASLASTRGTSAAPLFSFGGASARRASGAPGCRQPALQRRPRQPSPPSLHAA